MPAHLFQVKGYSLSSLGDVKLGGGKERMYEKVWDEADYVVPPAENGAFFVTTNVVITPNQTTGRCPEVRIVHLFFINFKGPKIIKIWLTLI